VDLLKRLGRPPAVAALDGEDSVYVVGGAVRDLLLDREPRELDFVVEGDALAVARRIGGRVVAHERFGTATVSVPGATFDLASARRERYERPGALPEVELGATLGEDLERRDFTVNAIALHLADGELTWVPRAHEDLEARRLRVLHDRSFVDDPTRLLRLVRYAARLGFEPEERTDRLAAEAIAGGALDTVTGSRLGAELRLLLREPQPAALMGLERHGLGRALLDDAFDPDERRIAVAHELGGPLAALASTLVGADDMRAVLDHLAFPANDRAAVADAARRAWHVVDLIDPDRYAMETGDPMTDAGLWRALRRERPETVAVVGALGQLAAARRWLDDLSHRRLAIDGNDLVAAGLQGPAVGAGLAAAMEAMLDGRADTREEQLAAALG
jgi:tRNA nucleotidyltransferase (CCA-adding enzyme)